MATDILFEDFQPSEELVALLRDFTMECISNRVPPKELIQFGKTCGKILEYRKAYNLSHFMIT